MEREHMEYLLRTSPGIGVEVTSNSGNTIYYFYEDFGPNADFIPDGIDRAMHQLYPLLNKGKIAKVTFIEHTEKVV
jgi:hypothetical protein